MLPKNIFILKDNDFRETTDTFFKVSKSGYLSAYADFFRCVKLHTKQFLNNEGLKHDTIR